MGARARLSIEIAQGNARSLLTGVTGACGFLALGLGTSFRSRSRNVGSRLGRAVAFRRWSVHGRKTDGFFVSLTADGVRQCVEAEAELDARDRNEKVPYFLPDLREKFARRHKNLPEIAGIAGPMAMQSKPGAEFLDSVSVPGLAPIRKTVAAYLEHLFGLGIQFGIEIGNVRQGNLIESRFKT